MGELPVQRQGVSVAENEVNPYGFPIQKKKKSTSTKRSFSQEDQIRETLLSLPLTGVIGSGSKVLLGNLILEQGEFVDDVLPGQTDRLLVKEITDTKVVIEWVEEFRRKVPRVVEIPIDMRTQVHALLKGQPDGQQKRLVPVRIPNSEGPAAVSVPGEGVE